MMSKDLAPTKHTKQHPVNTAANACLASLHSNMQHMLLCTLKPYARQSTSAGSCYVHVVAWLLTCHNHIQLAAVASRRSQGVPHLKLHLHAGPHSRHTTSHIHH
jgi:hypothetical protein